MPMNSETKMECLTCGTCRYYAERPAELWGICNRYGVCLKCSKPVDPSFGPRGTHAPGSRAVVIDRQRGVVRPGCWRAMWRAGDNDE